MGLFKPKDTVGSRTTESTPRVLDAPSSTSQLDAESSTSSAGAKGATSTPAAATATAAFPVTFPTGQANKVHHSYVWLGPLTATAAVLAASVLYNAGTIVQLYRFLQEEGLAGGLFTLLLALGAFFVIYAIVTLVYVLAWRNMHYVFEPTEFSLYSGIITKRQVHVPYARVQSVNHRAGLVQRIFGVCTVSIDTAGGASNKAVRVPYVTLADAERIRIDLFVRKAAVTSGAAELVQLVDVEAQAQAMGMQQAGVFDTAAQRAASPVSPAQLAAERAAQQAQQAQAGQAGGVQPNLLDDAAQQVSDWRGVFGGSSADGAGASLAGLGAAPTIAGMEPVTFESGLDNSQLLLTGTTAMSTEGAVISLGVSGVILGAVANVGFLEPWMAGLGTAIAIGMLVLGMVAGLVGSIVSYGNFRVRRRGSRVEVERGLLQRVFTGIDIDRVQSVVVKQSFIRRCLGYCEVSLGRINTTGGDANAQGNKQSLNQGGLVVHPFLKMDQVRPFLERLLPEFADMPVVEDLAPLPDVALRRGLIRQGLWRNPMVWTALGYAAMQVIMHLAIGPRAVPGTDDFKGLMMVDQIAAFLYAFGALFTVAVLVDTVLWKSGSGHALSQRYLAVFNSGLHTDFSVLPRTKIQSGNTRTNPFQQAAGVTTLVATTAAGARRTDAVLWDVTASQGAAWLDWLRPRTHHKDGTAGADNAPGETARGGSSTEDAVS